MTKLHVIVALMVSGTSNSTGIKVVGDDNYDITIVGTSSEKLSPSRLRTAQFTRAAVYHVLGYYIYPRLSTFDPDGDLFREKMTYYKRAFEEEFDLILREGVSYDSDSSGDYSDSEERSFHHNRLVR